MGVPSRAGAPTPTLIRVLCDYEVLLGKVRFFTSPRRGPSTGSDHCSVNAVERACTELARDGRPVTFTAIATATRLSRSTLYRNTALRAIVEHHKHAPDGPITAITDEIATLRAAVRTLAERVRSHEEQLRRLRN